jgi:hypothetical protein
VIFRDAAWQDTTLHPPNGLEGIKLRDALGGEIGVLRGNPTIGHILATFPVALLATP